MSEQYNATVGNARISIEMVDDGVVVSVAPVGACGARWRHCTLTPFSDGSYVIRGNGVTTRAIRALSLEGAIARALREVGAEYFRDACEMRSCGTGRVASFGVERMCDAIEAHAETIEVVGLGGLARMLGKGGE